MISERLYQKAQVVYNYYLSKLKGRLYILDSNIQVSCDFNQSINAIATSIELKQS